MPRYCIHKFMSVRISHSMVVLVYPPGCSRDDEGLTLETAALKLFKRSFYDINSVDNTKLSVFNLNL